MSLQIENVVFPSAPIAFDANGFAKRAGLGYLHGDGEVSKGIPLTFSDVEVVAVFELNDYKRLRAKFKVAKEQTAFVKQVHERLVQKASMFGSDTKVNTPIWDDVELNVGFPMLKGEPGVIATDVEDGQMTWKETNSLLHTDWAKQGRMLKIEVIMNIYARATTEKGTRVGYYFTLSRLDPEVKPKKKQQMLTPVTISDDEEPSPLLRKSKLSDDEGPLLFKKAKRVK